MNLSSHRQLPLFVRLRGGCFHERGWTLDAPGNFSNDVHFVFNNAERKVVGMEEAPWCRMDGREAVYVQLAPYADPRMAVLGLTTMCVSLADARKGSEPHLAAFAVGWITTLREGIGMKALAAADSLGFFGSFFGRGRVLDALNRHGSVEPLFALDPLAVVADALGK